ncbi:MAG TPA: DUF2069 domain-containing protein [Rhodanobacteraceae bacterium]|nr:DUF2069 domain-containing protein [Rhodanobacteraceae bacterium]
MTVPLPGRVRHARRVGYATWILLAGLQVVWHAWWRPPAQEPMLAAIVALVPLLLPLLAIRRSSRALLWAGIIALFYFCHGISTAWTVPVERVPALLETLLSVILILALGAGVQKRTPAARPG